MIVSTVLTVCYDECEALTLGLLPGPLRTWNLDVECVHLSTVLFPARGTWRSFLWPQNLGLPICERGAETDLWPHGGGGGGRGGR